MKKSEKIFLSLAAMAIGVLLIVLKDNFIGILMTVAGLCLIVFGIVDLFKKCVPPGVVKIVTGLLVILCGWFVVEAVLYVVSAFLLVFGILSLYDKIKQKFKCSTLLRTIMEYAVPSICIAIGILLLFHRGKIVDFIFIFSGILALAEGGVLLFNAFSEE